MFKFKNVLLLTACFFSLLNANAQTQSEPLINNTIELETAEGNKLIVSATPIQWQYNSNKPYLYVSLNKLILSVEGPEINPMKEVTVDLENSIENTNNCYYSNSPTRSTEYYRVQLFPVSGFKSAADLIASGKMKNSGDETYNSNVSFITLLMRPLFTCGSAVSLGQKISVSLDGVKQTNPADGTDYFEIDIKSDRHEKFRQ